MKKQKKSCQGVFGDICGMAVLGERGQIVIPKEARRKNKMATGDAFLVVEHDGAVILLPEVEMRRMAKQVVSHFQTFSKKFKTKK